MSFWLLYSRKNSLLISYATHRNQLDPQMLLPQTILTAKNATTNKLEPRCTPAIEFRARSAFGMRILLVEDESTAAAVLAKGLREQGYAVDLAADGEEAAYKASISDYDLIILDLMLPVKDGLTVCRELRAEGATVPILMLTARDTLNDRVVGLDQGADDYITKPFEYRELLARIRALLRRGSTKHLGIVQIADLQVDLQARRASRAGHAIDLRGKEYSLLEYMARRAGELVT